MYDEVRSYLQFHKAINVHINDHSLHSKHMALTVLTAEAVSVVLAHLLEDPKQ